MILAVLLDGDGRPVCSEMGPGNTADVTTLVPVIVTLVPVIERLRRRFSIARVCVVADRGMISADTMAGLEGKEKKPPTMETGLERIAAKPIRRPKLFLPYSKLQSIAVL